MFLEKLTKLLNQAFHRPPEYITVSVAAAQAVSQPAAALPPSRLLPPDRSSKSSAESVRFKSGVTFRRMSAMAA